MVIASFAFQALQPPVLLAGLFSGAGGAFGLLFGRGIVGFSSFTRTCSLRSSI